MEKAESIRKGLMLGCWVWIAVAGIIAFSGFSPLHVYGPLIAALVFSVGHSVIAAMIALHKENPND